jgi:hypothetical protein
MATAAQTTHKSHDTHVTLKRMGGYRWIEYDDRMKMPPFQLISSVTRTASILHGARCDRRAHTY